jgi:NAD-dependent DNA ligase
MSTYERLISQLNKITIVKLREKLSTCSPRLLKALKNECDRRYYTTGEETLEDLRYDILVEIIEERDPAFCVKVGGKLRHGDNKTNLPYLLGGMDKIKGGEDSKLLSWKQKHPSATYVVSDKLNGVSCLIVYKSGECSMYTRGDKETGEGSDISYLKDKIWGIPSGINDIAIRGEIIIDAKVFETRWKNEYKNSLALIVSVVNAKTLKEAIKDLRFIAYEIVVEGVSPPLETQLSNLISLGFETPEYRVVQSFSSEMLSSCLNERKERSRYDIDGLVVCVNNEYNRSNTSASGNPEYAFAFKMLLEVETAEVADIEWRPSRWGTLVPRIRIKPIKLRGITIEHTTGFNAAYIRDNKINVGSKLLITRSGDVIPYIVKVLTQSEEPLFPSVPYTWNETKVDIVSSESRIDVDIQKIVYFFVSIGVKQINKGLVKRLYENGLDTLRKILCAKKEDFMKIPSFKDKLSERLANNISIRVCNVDLADLAVASCAFGNGIGKKKFRAILNVFGDFLNTTPSVEEICKIEGFSTKTGKKIVDGLYRFKEFLHELRDIIKIKQRAQVSENKLGGKKFVFSGFRDAVLKNSIESLGGMVSDSVSTNTYAVIVKDVTVSSSKVEKAKKLGVRIIHKEELQIIS